MNRVGFPNKTNPVNHQACGYPIFRQTDLPGDRTIVKTAPSPNHSGAPNLSWGWADIDIQETDVDPACAFGNFRGFWRIQWIGLVGKILTGNHRLSHESHGAFRLKFSLKPIHWRMVLCLYRNPIANLPHGSALELFRGTHPLIVPNGMGDIPEILCKWNSNNFSGMIYI